MLLPAERERIVHFGKKMATAGLTAGSGGNLSIVDRQKGQVAISPSGIDYFETRPADVVITDLQGSVVDGTRKPSSELFFHLALYAAREDIGAVVHTHSTYATTLACLNWELPPIHYMIGLSGLKVPLAPYATYGTRSLARNITNSIGDNNAVLLANHGLVAVGRTLPSAFDCAEEIEFVARIYCQARMLGKPVVLTEEEMQKVIDKFTRHGQ
jgi:L-fuculose-phosphate aldolase